VAGEQADVVGVADAKVQVARVFTILTEYAEVIEGHEVARRIAVDDTAETQANAFRFELGGWFGELR
jgi:hypothetical protein